MSTLFDNKEKLITALQAQKIVSSIEHNRIVAEKLAQAVRVKEYTTGDIITEQNAKTDEMYFILSGSVEVLVNGRHKAFREKDETVGEMSLVDVGGERSATVVINRPAELARIEQQNFTRIAAEHPELWRNIARCLAYRLRKRNDRERDKNPKPIVFMASSSEGKGTMEAIADGIRSDAIEVRPWTSDGLFEPSTHAIETLEKMANEADFAVIILSPDDRVKYRGTNMPSPRDNVIFEQGLFVGGVGRHRTFVVECSPKQTIGSKLPIVGRCLERALKIPSDYYGLTVFRCSTKQRLLDICEEIKRHISRLGTI